MTALRYFIDEDLLGLARTWGANCSDCCWPGHQIDVRVGDPDTTWVPIVGQNNLVAITKDKRISRRPAEIEALIAEKLRVLRLTVGRKPRTIEDLATRLDRHWTRIERFVETRPRGPWLVSVSDQQIKELGIGHHSAGWGDTIPGSL